MKHYIPQSQRLAPQPQPAKPRALIDVDAALLDRNLLGAALGNPSTWFRWLAVLRAAFALPMTASDLDQFKVVAGNRERPTTCVNELWATVGRRSGKSRIAAALAVHAALLHPRHLARGKYVRSELNKSQLYLEALPQFMRQAISLPNHPKLLGELRLLERRTSRMGKDQVDHGAHGSDDYANALCGALRSLTRSVDVSMAWVSGDADETVSGKETHAAMMLKSYLFGRGVLV